MQTASFPRGIVLAPDKLRELRRQRGVKQLDLAVASGVSEAGISRAERGQSISLENAGAIAAFFNATVAELSGATPVPTAPEPERLPPRKPLPTALSNIPIRVPPHFMGREAALAAIDQAFAHNRGRVAITALHGLRGVGKTVLAAAYAQAHAQDYRATWWLRAETEATLRADLVGLGVRLGWVAPDAPEADALAAVMQLLAQDGGGLLLVFDNALDADALRPYLPHGGASRALITSNAHAWRSLAAPIRLYTWPEEIGAAFLTARTGRTDEHQAALELSELLGGLPLAHEQAAAYCERLDIPLAEYTRRFKAEPARLLDTQRDAAAEYHDRTTVAKSFALAIEAATKPPLGHPAAGKLIELCALLAPEPIPLFLFAEGREEFGEPLASALAGDGLDEAVSALRAFALIDKETIPDERDPAFATETIRLHRLVREIAAAGIGDTRQALLGALTEAMASVYPAGVYNDPAAWRLARRLDALALPLVEGDLPDGTDQAVSYLLDRLAGYREAVLANFPDARRLFERALALDENRLGPEHPQTLTSVNNLAYCLYALGDAAGALPLYRRALKSRERVLGPEHPQTLTSVNNLAGCLYALGDATGALPLYRRAAEGLEQLLGPEHPNTRIVRRNLAGLEAEIGS
jgi:transcriptional regulator with XRE-family HTH domain/tetratricopeptide (TPR) repeat protein